MSEIDDLFAEHGWPDLINIDDEFQTHMDERATYDKHLVTGAEVLEVHANKVNKPAFFDNRGSKRKAPVIMVGPTLAGRFLCVPIEPTGRFGVWRPVTAYEANTHHRDAYRRSNP